MKITVIGAGAMGGLFASKLSEKNDVTIIDLNRTLIEKIEKDGLLLTETDGVTKAYHFNARTSSENMETQDLIILFVKAMFSHSALEANKAIIGDDTYLLTMQNGMGHESLLEEFVNKDHVLLGTTQHNASVKALGENIHGGKGPSYISSMGENNEKVMDIAKTLTDSGIECTVSENVKRMIWEKLFTNISASVLTGILQKPLGYIAADPNAWALCERLIKEAVIVAKADGYDFDFAEKCENVKKVCNNSPEGLTSVYADIKNGRRTEVDTISGAVLKKAKEYGIDVPYTEYSITLIHALENR